MLGEEIASRTDLESEKIINLSWEISLERKMASEMAQALAEKIDVWEGGCIKLKSRSGQIRWKNSHIDSRSVVFFGIIV